MTTVIGRSRQSSGGSRIQNLGRNTIDLVIFACLDSREFVILGLFTKSRIRELSTSMIGSAHNNNFHEILKLYNHYQIYNMTNTRTEIFVG